MILSSMSCSEWVSFVCQAITSIRSLFLLFWVYQVPVTQGRLFLAPVLGEMEKGDKTEIWGGDGMQEGQREGGIARQD